MSYRPVFISASFLLVFAVIGSGLVAFTFDSTEERIAENQRRALLKSLNQLVPSDRYDNDIFSDTLLVHDPELLGTDEPVSVW
jgi:electron transport complex protein RnfG